MWPFFFRTTIRMYLQIYHASGWSEILLVSVILLLSKNNKSICKSANGALWSLYHYICKWLYMIIISANGCIWSLLLHLITLIVLILMMIGSTYHLDLEVVGGFNPLKHISQSGWLFPVYLGKYKMFQTTSQVIKSTFTDVDPESPRNAPLTNQLSVPKQMRVAAWECWHLTNSTGHGEALGGLPIPDAPWSVWVWKLSDFPKLTI